VSDVSAFIIPRRVFSTPDDYQTFRDTLTKYHDAAMESLQADETDEMDESDERATEEREESAERVG
jgi:ABC-type transporter lipoprotein component MlaA